jgi:NhaP-type Na+/H+ or K+/H+ antiporter
LGYLATIIFASVAAKKWGPVKSDEVENRVNLFWIMLMPLLYGILGSGIDFDIVDSDIMWRAFVVMIVGAIVRVPLSYISVIKADLNHKEKLFISIAWIPKATVQAALGGVILGIIDQKNLGTTYYKYGQSILAITLLSILITAPLGALLIGLLGKKLLKQANPAAIDPEFRVNSIDKYEGMHVDHLYLQHVIPNKIVKVVILSPENRIKSNKTRSLSAESDEQTPVSIVSML